jgi:peptidoglycan/LPS O-acetylase OafA/YrhL
MCLILTHTLIHQWTLRWPKKSLYYESGQHSAYGASNIYFIYGNENVAPSEETYFTEASDQNIEQNMKFNPFLHTWSLGVEEQFYLVYPCIFKVALLGYSNNKYRALSVIGICFLVSLFVSLLYGVVMTSSQFTQNFHFFFPFSRFWEMLAGCLLMVIFSKYEKEFNTLTEGTKRICSICCDITSVACFAVSFATPQASVSFPFPMAFIPVLGTLTYIIGGHHPFKSYLNKCLTSKVAVYIGKISYPLYLVHWPVIVFLRWNNLGYGIKDTDTIFVIYFLLITISISIFLYHGIELRLKTFGIFLSKSKMEYILVSVLSLILLAIAVSMHIMGLNYDPQPQDMPLTNTISGCQCSYDNFVTFKPFHQPKHVVELSTNLCFVDQRWGGTKAVTGYGSHGTYVYQTYIFLSNKVYLKNTTTPNGQKWMTEYDQVIHYLGMNMTKDKPHVFSIGDSLGLQNVEILKRAISGRYTISNLYINGLDNCAESFFGSVNALNALKMLVRKGDFVVMSIYVDSTFRKMKNYKGENFWYTYYDDMRRILGPYVKIIWVGYTPSLNVMGVYAPMPGFKSPIHGNKTHSANLRKEFNTVFQKKTSNDMNGFFLDFSYLLEDGNGNAGPYIPSTYTLLYYDDYHLTKRGTYYLWPFVCEWLNVNNITKT